MHSSTKSNEGTLVANSLSVQKQLLVTLPFEITKIKNSFYTHRMWNLGAEK
jgi:hypothetical protein